VLRQRLRRTVVVFTWRRHECELGGLVWLAPGHFGFEVAVDGFAGAEDFGDLGDGVFAFAVRPGLVLYPSTG
jgi:hypothetical protein